MYNKLTSDGASQQSLNNIKFPWTLKNVLGGGSIDSYSKISLVNFEIVSIVHDAIFFKLSLH